MGNHCRGSLREVVLPANTGVCFSCISQAVGKACRDPPSSPGFSRQVAGCGDACEPGCWPKRTE